MLCWMAKWLECWLTNQNTPRAPLSGGSPLCCAGIMKVNKCIKEFLTCPAAGPCVPSLVTSRGSAQPAPTSPCKTQTVSILKDPSKRTCDVNEIKHYLSHISSSNAVKFVLCSVFQLFPTATKHSQYNQKRHENPNK